LHESPAPLLSEIRRVLRPGGYLILSTPNGANLQNRLKLLLGRTPMFPIETWYYQVPFSGHIREFTMDELTKILGFADFDVIHKDLTESPRRNTPLGRGRWRRGLRVKRPSHIARVAYHVLVSVVPGLRYACLLIARRPHSQISPKR
jgi:SAM-dependent methyltransferase